MSNLKVTDKKIRQMYRRKSENIAREQMYLAKNNHIKFLTIIAIVESIGIIGLIVTRCI